MRRVTVTLPEAVVEEMDRWESNRSKFLLQAAQHELQQRRLQELQRSLGFPHPDSSRVAESGVESWGEGWSADDDGLVDPGAGTAVRWRAGEGWEEGGE